MLSPWHSARPGTDSHVTGLESYVTPDGWLFYLRRDNHRLTDHGVLLAGGPDSNFSSPELRFSSTDCDTSRGGHFITAERNIAVYEGTLWVYGDIGLRMNRNPANRGIYTTRSFLAISPPGTQCFERTPSTAGGFGVTVIDLAAYGFQYQSLAWRVVNPQWELDRVDRPLFCSDFEQCAAERSE